MIVSSENIIGLIGFEALCTSFTYKMNKKGPKIDPCGTQHKLFVPKLLSIIDTGRLTERSGLLKPKSSWLR